MHIAVVGCLHGELDNVYEDIQRQEKEQNVTVDLVIVCGDFQAVRNQHDLPCMAVPPKYRTLGFFHDYYFGRKKVPILTIFVGGNHEASNYLSTLPYGGWVCPNIYYLGYASVVRFGGLRIAGISGIFKRHDSEWGHFERLPYDNSTLRSVFHTRQLEAYRMRMLKAEDQNSQLVDIMITHDWPLNIHSCGNVGLLLRMKPFFREDIDKNQLGNPLYQPLVNHLKPRQWFAAHLHVRFEAFVDHADNVLTRFLALDKCLPRRKYVEIVSIDPKINEEKVLSYDPEWLAILKESNQYMSPEKIPLVKLPPTWINPDPVPQTSIDEVVKVFNGDLTIPFNFSLCDPVTSPDIDLDPHRQRNYVNPQTTTFCRKLGVLDPISKIINGQQPIENPDKIDLDDLEEDEDNGEVGGDNNCKRQKRNETDDALQGGEVLFVVDKKGCK